MDRWEQFNSIIDNGDLSLKEIGLLLILFRFVNHKSGYANPSRVNIKKLAKITDNRTLDNILNSLCEKGYLVKEKSIGRRTKYFIKVGVKNTPIVGVEITPSVKPTPSVKITPPVGVEITPQKEKEKEYKKENIYIDFHTQFSDGLGMVTNIKIYPNEMSALLDKFNKNLVYRKIRELDEYLLNNPDKEYKNHYLTLLNWLDRDKGAAKVTEKEITKKYF